MRALDRKLLRDLWRLKTQAFAIMMVTACGIAALVTALSNITALERSRDHYYETNAFADAWVQLVRAPESVAERIGQLDGVAVVETRVAQNVTGFVEGFPEPISARLVSIPDRGVAQLNRVHIVEGRRPSPDRAGEILVSAAFADAHDLPLGARIEVVINGTKQDLEMVGVALSPEYVYQIVGAAAFPDDERFAVLWMPRTPLAAAIDMEGAFNDVALQLGSHANEAKLLEELDLLLDRYGGLGAYGRDKQMSNRYLDQELGQLRGQGLIAPMIFLGVAAFLLNVVVSRLVSTQREQIAALKAVGYRNWDVGMHFGKLVLIVTLVGVAVGGWMGAVLGRAQLDLYAQFFRFPDMRFEIDASLMAQTGLIALAACGLGTGRAVWGAVSLPPPRRCAPRPRRATTIRGSSGRASRT